MHEEQKNEEIKIFLSENCYENKDKKASECSYCFVSTDKSTYSRKCFMTGEYCSKQTNIQKERKELHEKDNITAFVIMSFSNMTDVVYKWRIKNFIESLKIYLAFDKNRQKICCCKEIITDDMEIEENKTNYKRIKEIFVERSDTDPASNYVMCSRICQRIQIADLIIVDVSHQNPNVFYELGMAIALGKLILPICFSESYYKMEVPKLVKETDPEYKIIEHHIGSYPWRKKLFEYYGISYKRRDEGFFEEDDTSNQQTHYMTFDKATKIEYGFSDIQYNRFPYHEEITMNVENSQKEKIGKMVYNNLRESYNHSTQKDNTLIVYTMDDILNKKQAGKCIVNFYHMITARMQQSQCFCGNRVGVLVQGNGIPEEDKDSERQIDLFYSIGEIIHIGVNEATYLAAEKRLKSDDVVLIQQDVETTDSNITPNDKITEKQKNNIIRAVKEYIGNRGIIIYPNNPIYVKREKNKFEIINPKSEDGKNSECNCCNMERKYLLYHKTLEALRYVNEIVVDISNNSLQSLFWLGVAHGLDVNAITVLHEATEKEQEKITGSKEKKIRTVFDVAGLWTAILHSSDTDGFYKQLAQVQYGIEQHLKLMMKNQQVYEERLHEGWIALDSNYNMSSIEELYREEKREKNFH